MIITKEKEDLGYRWGWIQIRNKRNGKTICKSCQAAKTPFSKAIGLMFCSDRKKEILFVFKKEGRQPIHSFFVKYPFLAFYIDNAMRVTEKFKVKPNQVYVSNRKNAKYLLESFNLGIDLKEGDCIECLDGL